jgi:hypothetical protein
MNDDGGTGVRKNSKLNDSDNLTELFMVISFLKLVATYPFRSCLVC